MRRLCISFAMSIPMFSCHVDLDKTHHSPSSSTVIYVDAGSSGTRLSIFSVKHDDATEHISIQDMGSIDTLIHKGLHTITLDKQSIADYLNPLFDYAEKTIGEEAHKVPVYIYATGGFRSVSEEKQNHIIQEVEGYLKKDRHYEFVHMKVLTGDEEGIFGWLTTNYLLGYLEKGQKETHGIVDVGGATVQIVYEVKDKKEATAQFHFEDRNYFLFVHSYPLGQNALLDHTQSIKQTCVIEKPSQARFQNCVHEIYQKTHTSLPQEVKVQGSFVGMGGLVYLGKDMSDHSFSLKNLDQWGRSVCKKTKEDVKLNYKAQFPDILCYRLSYTRALLFGDLSTSKHTLGFTKDMLVKAPDEIKGQKSFGWTLGAILYNYEKN